MIPPRMTDYAATARAFRWDAPERFNFARDVVDVWATDPAKPALLWFGRAAEDGERQAAPAAPSRSRVRGGRAMTSGAGLSDNPAATQGTGVHPQ